MSLLAAAADRKHTASRRLIGWIWSRPPRGTLLMDAAGLTLFAAAVEGSPVIAWTPRFALSLAFLALVGTAATTVA
jgi:hypothetical protein